MSKSYLLLECLDSLDWKVYVDLCDSLTSVDRSDLDTELENQARIYSYYHGMMMEAKRQTGIAERRLTNYSATTAKDFRDQLKHETRKPTDAYIQQLVSSTEECQKLADEYEELRSKFDLLKALVSALEQKKDMLVQLSSNRRAEVKLYA